MVSLVLNALEHLALAVNKCNVVSQLSFKYAFDMKLNRPHICNLVQRQKFIYHIAENIGDL